MSLDEFNNLGVGDVIYYYNPINVMRISHISASLRKKVVDTIFINTSGEKRITLKDGGVILKSLLDRFDTDKEKLLYRKLVEIRKKVNEVNNEPNRLKHYPKSLTEKYNKLLEQKNVQPMLEKYPELLI